jgi:glycosyltransferase involved in cell wall biosynthesis
MPSLGEKPKILLVHNRYQQFGGEDAVFRAEKELLTARGHQVLEYVEDNQRIDGMNRLALAGRTIWSVQTHEKIRNIIRNERPHLVHCHNTFPLISPSIYWACKDEGVPVVQTLHNYRLLCPAGSFIRKTGICEECLGKKFAWPAIEHACYHDSRGVSGVIATMLSVHRALGTWQNLINVYVALSEFARGKFVEGGLPGEKITVSPNFVAPDPGLREGHKDYAVFVGRLSPEKGLMTLLKAWKQLGRNIGLRILGDGPLRGELEAEALENHLTNVSFEGRRERSEVLAAMKGARFLVLPSECYENFPVVVAEAFACGVPVLASRLGSLAEIVGDHRTGLQFKPEDHQDLAAKVQWAWDHGKEMEGFGLAARAEFETKYTADCKYISLMTIYERALKVA